MDFVIKQISKDHLVQNINQYIDILKDVPNEYWGEDNFLVELPDKFKLSCCVMVDDKLIGYIISTSKDSLTAHINKFMVLSKYRGSGIGSRLFYFYENLVEINKMNLITLKVYKNNEPAIRFYLRNGFVHESEGIDSVNSEVLVKMRKEL